jgi:hypothetical protein
MEASHSTAMHEDEADGWEIPIIVANSPWNIHRLYIPETEAAIPL